MSSIFNCVFYIFYAHDTKHNWRETDKREIRDERMYVRE